MVPQLPHERPRRRVEDSALPSSVLGAVCVAREVAHVGLLDRLHVISERLRRGKEVVEQTVGLVEVLLEPGPILELERLKRLESLPSVAMLS
jgi:hypothetical protein